MNSDQKPKPKPTPQSAAERMFHETIARFHSLENSVNALEGGHDDRLYWISNIRETQLRLDIAIKALIDSTRAF